MSSIPEQPEAADFVSDWLQSKKEDGNMDAKILESIGKHRSSDGLNEQALVKDLMELADREEGADAAS